MVYFVGEIKFLIRLFILLLSCYGYIQYLRKTVRLEFCIGLLFSGIGSALFLAGILNLLREATWFIWLGGLVLAGQSIKKKESPANVMSLGILFFLGLAGYFLLLLPGSEFTHYDNFSHWALVSQIVSQQGRFPNYSDSLIEFPSYPLGSASFIFYITETLGSSAEWVQMYAQAILISGMLVSLFAFARNPVQAFVTAICSVFLLCGNIRLTDLLVDSLLPIVALSAMAMCIYYGQELRRMLWLTIPYVIFLVSIKNSGILFVVILYIYLWITLRRETVSPKLWSLLLCVPALIVIVWQKHVKAMFQQGLMAKHSMSLRYLGATFLHKGLSEICDISVQMVKRVFAVSNPALWLLLFGLLMWILWKYITKTPCRDRRNTFLLAVASYVLYQMGTWGMYLFSMPNEEALILAGYSRYHQTIVMFLAGLILIEALQELDTPKDSSGGRLAKIGTLLATLVLSFYMISPNFSSFHKQRLENTERYKLDQMIAQYNLPARASYLILTSKDRHDAGYLFYLSWYLLSPSALKILPETELDTIDPFVYDYVIAFEETEGTKAFLSELSPDGEPVVCLR